MALPPAATEEVPEGEGGCEERRAGDGLPNTLPIGLRGVKAARVLAALNDSVAASASAACHTADVAKSSISFVLRALDVPIEFAVGTLRLSVGRHTTRASSLAYRFTALVAPY